MTDKILYWASMVSASIAFLLFVTNSCLINSNMKIQEQINQRQMVINTASKVLPLSQQLSNAIYDASVKNNDAGLRALLTSQGFTLPSKADKEKAAKVAEEAKAKKSTAKNVEE